MLNQHFFYIFSLNILRTVAQTPIKHYFLQEHVEVFQVNISITACDIHFCIWKLSKFIFMSPPLGPSWSVKYLNFGQESCEIRILFLLILEKNIKKSKKKNSFYFFCRVENQICLTSWSIDIVYYKYKYYTYGWFQSKYQVYIHSVIQVPQITWTTFL